MRLVMTAEGLHRRKYSLTSAPARTEIRRQMCSFTLCGSTWYSNRLNQRRKFSDSFFHPAHNVTNLRYSHAEDNIASRQWCNDLTARPVTDSGRFASSTELCVAGGY